MALGIAKQKSGDSKNEEADLRKRFMILKTMAEMDWKNSRNGFPFSPDWPAAIPKAKQQNRRPGEERNV